MTTPEHPADPQRSQSQHSQSQRSQSQGSDAQRSDQRAGAQRAGAHPAPNTTEEWEQVRRSVAMLPPGAWAMRREQALQALSQLLTGLRSTPRR